MMKQRQQGRVAKQLRRLHWRPVCSAGLQQPPIECKEEREREGKGPIQIGITVSLVQQDLLHQRVARDSQKYNEPLILCNECRLPGRPASQHAEMNDDDDDAAVRWVVRTRKTKLHRVCWL